MNVPKLRFREFSGEWEKKLIQNCIDEGLILEHLDGNHGELYPRSEEFSKRGIAYISANDFMDGKVNFDSCKKLPFERAKKFKKGIAKDNDVLFAHNATVGPVAILRTSDDFAILSTTATYFRCNATKLNNVFLSNDLLSTGFVKQYSRIMKQSTRNQVPITTQRKLEVSIPSLPEQQKIADFLSTFDEKIENQQNIIKNLEQQKKGLMQKIFSQALRFKDQNDNDFPQWEEKKLGEVFTVNAGGDIDKSSFNKEYSSEFCYPVYANSLINKGLYGYSNSYKVEGETITVTGRGDVGTAVARYEKYYPIVRLLILRKKSDLNIRFYEEAINYCNIFVESTGVPQLTAPQISKVVISSPSLAEQQKIADFLSAFDEKIEAQKQILTHLQNTKKGLLQQMFC